MHNSLLSIVGLAVALLRPELLVSALQMRPISSEDLPRPPPLIPLPRPLTGEAGRRARAQRNRAALQDQLDEMVEAEEGGEGKENLSQLSTSQRDGVDDLR